MTWGEFKHRIESRGADDDTLVLEMLLPDDWDSIGDPHLEVEVDEDPESGASHLRVYVRSMLRAKP
jgi:hypothetical protein